MNYNQLIETISLIIENDKILKNGLILTYELDLNTHKSLQEELFYKSNDYSVELTYTDEFDVTVEGILIKFIKKT